MISKLAIMGGKPAVTRKLLPFNGIGRKEKEAVLKLLDSDFPLSGFHGSARPTFYGGEQVLALEETWSNRFKVKHSISMNSATSALFAAMGAIGISPGDEVIVPPYTMTATAVAPLIYGGVPVFVDIEPNFFCLDIDKLMKAITPSTRAIIAVNLFGHPCELLKLRELSDRLNIFLIEDNSQAVIAEDEGHLAGTIGHIGVYSLNVHKHIQSGEGGVCVTNDQKLAKKLQLIRNHGENVVNWLGINDLTNLVGFNFRMTEITAAIARIQLERVDELVGRVENICNKLSSGISDLPGFTPPRVRSECRHNYYMWSATYDASIVGTTREKFSHALALEGFPNSCGYVQPIYQLPLFQQKIAIGKFGYPFNDQNNYDYDKRNYPITEIMYNEKLIQFQPVSWTVDDEQVCMLIESIHKVYHNARLL